MADVPENLVLELLRAMRAEFNAKFDHLTVRADGTDARLERLAAEQTATNAKIDSVAAEQQEMRSEQRAMRTEFSAKFERLTTRGDRIVSKLNHVAIRADDVMGAQVRMKTDIAALRAIQEEGGRALVDEFREDMESLRDRVEALEEQRRG